MRVYEPYKYASAKYWRRVHKYLKQFNATDYLWVIWVKKLSAGSHIPFDRCDVDANERANAHTPISFNFLLVWLWKSSRLHSTPFNITNKNYDFINSARCSLLIMKWPVIIVILYTRSNEKGRRKKNLFWTKIYTAVKSRKFSGDDIFFSVWSIWFQLGKRFNTYTGHRNSSPAILLHSLPAKLLQKVLLNS